MIFVVGGAYQGKSSYVQDNFNDDYRIISDYHLRVRRQLEAGLNPIEEWERLWQDSLTDGVCQSDKTGEGNPDKVIIVSEDLGSGLVPIDPFERQYREQLGRVNCLIAGEAQQVIRVISGIGTRIK